MSMIGRLRQMSASQLASYKKNPRRMSRALSGPEVLPDPAQLAELRETLQQSPAVRRMMELQQNAQVLPPELQAEVQQEITRLMNQAVDVRSRGLEKIAAADNEATNEGGNEELDLHKSWHCLHFMLTGKAEETGGTPLGDAILGGTEFGGEEADTGYGPPRALSPEQTRAVAAALAGFPVDRKAQEFDAAAAEKAGIYVPQHGAEELKQYFAQLRKFYEDAARKGNAVVLWIE